MKFYIASSFRNINLVRKLSTLLIERGFIHTYDWTINQNVQTLEELREIGIKEKNAVLDSDIVVVIFPAGKGSHIELGIALGSGKKIYLYSPTVELNDISTTSTFYHLPEVEKCLGSLDELVNEIVLNSSHLLNEV